MNQWKSAHAVDTKARTLAQAMEGADVFLGLSTGALHGTITELATGRSLGKAFVGARVVTITGVRPSAATILFRNAFKLLVLLIPVLAVFALLNPNVQGLGDSVARTLVVGDAKAAPNDR